MKIFILDDTERDRQTLAAPFCESHEVRCAPDLESAKQVLANWWPDLAIVDAVFPRQANSKPLFSAGAFLEFIETQEQIENCPAPDIILVSGQNEAAKKFDDVCDWLQHGRISDVIPKSTADIGKSFFQAVIQLRVERLLSQQHWRAAQRTSQKTAEWFQTLGITTASAKILALSDHLLAAAASSAAVLIQGPNGSGKELIAKAIHKLSRTKRPFIACNCATIPVELFESEMFGIEKHGPSQTYVEKPGLFGAAEDGTVFLDEVHSLRPMHQVGLNRVLQERLLHRVGGTADQPMRAKVISATNKDLRELVEEGAFGMDLYHRLAVFLIKVPSLGERKEDIPLLAESFLSDFQNRHHVEAGFCPRMRLGSKTTNLLIRHSWPGNVRELQNCIEAVANLELVRHRSAEEIEISLSALLEVRPELNNVVHVSSSQYDAALEVIAESPARYWSEFTESNIPELTVFIRERLSTQGNELFLDMQMNLESRSESRDPASLHCYKALLYLLLTDTHRASIPELQAVLQLRAWESVKKVATVLSEARGTREPRALVSKMKSEGRWLFVLSAGIVHTVIPENSPLK